MGVPKSPQRTIPFVIHSDHLQPELPESEQHWPWTMTACDRQDRWWFRLVSLALGSQIRLSGVGSAFDMSYLGDLERVASVRWGLVSSFMQ